MRLPDFLASCYKAGVILPLLFLGVAFAHERPKVERSHAQAMTTCSDNLRRLTFTHGDMSLLTNALLFTRMPTL